MWLWVVGVYWYLLNLLVIVLLSLGWLEVCVFGYGLCDEVVEMEIVLGSLGFLLEGWRGHDVEWK